MRLKSTVLLAFFSFSLYAIEDPELQKIQQQIQAMNQATAAAKKNEGQALYEQHCVVCHRDGLAGAPKMRNSEDWKPRLSGRAIDDLVVSAMNGLNAMPPKGTCSGCNEADLKAVIQYMLPRS